jgi:ABC-type iron transport system FetAB ATPase subunit
MRIEQEKLNVLKPLTESLFSNGFLSVSKMTEFFSKSVISQMSVRFGYIKVGRSLDFCMAVITLIYAFYLPNDRLFLVKYAIIRKITSAISCMVNFQSSYQSFSDEYNVYFKKLTELLSPSKNTVEYTTHESLRVPPTGLVITRINIKVSPDYSITGENFPIGRSDQIVLRGPAGIGKSSLLRAIANKIPGITLFGNIIQDYESDILLPARILDGLFLPLLSISDIFVTSSPEDFTRIQSFMKLLYGSNYRKISHKLLPFNNRIKGELSAGERQILFLVWILYQIEKRKCAVLLLDEPEQNLDETTKSDVMMALYKYLSEHRVATIWCTHTGDDQIRALKEKGLKFTRSVQIVKQNETTAHVIVTDLQKS